MQPSIFPQTADAPLQLILRSIQATDTQQAGSTGLLQQQIPQAPNTILPSQLFSDTLKMIAPVGQSPNDEQLLVMTLQSGLSQGLDHRRAIEKLHGVNNHAANLWKDYYLENKSHIDDMVSQLQPKKTTKPVRFGQEPRVLFAPSEIKPKQPKRGRFADMGSRSILAESGSSRGNIIPRTRARESPLTLGKRKHRRASRHSDLPIPPPPEVEPIPPTEVVGSPKGNLYTLEEKKYFSKYISWALQVDPSLTKSELVKKLAENVPRHTASSWNAYWARDPLADRLLVAARERTNGVYQGRGSTGNAEKDVENDQETAEEESSYDPENDEAATSEHSRFFTAAEVRTMAKYIARYDPADWAMMTSKQRWYRFQHDHPHRSEVAYGLKYRSKEQELLKLAEQYRRRA